MSTAVKSAFAQYEKRAYPYLYRGKMHVASLAGGTPSNPDVAGAWLKAKLGDEELQLAAAVAEVMVERGLSEQEAVAEVSSNRHLKGFKRDPERGLYIEGRQLKAALKEAASVARAVGKLDERWGLTRKGILSFVAEHIGVLDQRLYLGRTEPDDVIQSFVHTFRGSGIDYTEVVYGVDLEFRVEADHEFKESDWAMLWLTGERQGIGAMRSQGFGQYTLTEWEQYARRNGNGSRG